MNFRRATATKSIGAFVDVLTRVYHEARNVRHLISAGFLEPTARERIRSQPINRVKAWQAIQPIRARAKRESSAAGAETVFRSHFGASLGDLRVLYENPNWKGAGDYGGNHWAGITRAVIAWSDAIDTDNASTSERI